MLEPTNTVQLWFLFQVFFFAFDFSMFLFFDNQLAIFILYMFENVFQLQFEKLFLMQINIFFDPFPCSVKGKMPTRAATHTQKLKLQLL